MLAGPLLYISDEPVARYTISVVSVLLAFGGVFALIFIPKILAVEIPAMNGVDHVFQLGGDGKPTVNRQAFVPAHSTSVGSMTSDIRPSSPFVVSDEITKNPMQQE